jgi:hypothetical protein
VSISEKPRRPANNGDAVGGEILTTEGLSDEDVAGMAWLDDITECLIAGIAKFYPAAGQQNSLQHFYLRAAIVRLGSIDRLDRILRLSPRGSGRLRKDAPSLQSETIALLTRLSAPTRGDDKDLMQELAVMLKPGGRSNLQLKFGRRQRGSPRSKIGIMLNQEYMLDLGRIIQEMIAAGEPMYDGRKSNQSKLICDQLGISLSQAEKALKAYRRRKQK